MMQLSPLKLFGLALILLTFACAALIYLNWTQPAKDDLALMERRVRLEEKLASAAQKHPEQREKQTAAADALPSDPAIDGLVQQLGAVEKDAKCVISDISFEKAESDSTPANVEKRPYGLNAVTAELSVSAPDEQAMTRFLQRIETMPRTVTIDAVQLDRQPDQKSGPIAFTVTLSAFYIEPSASR